ncbi:MAG TPA: DUF402 domain-containing protein [Chloroflexota bacterium]|nr:DUF402 domain-containing protein [Chloroflexota bacterium]
MSGQPSQKRPPVRVRGIYATALTRVLIDLGFPIAEPSPAIVGRFRLRASSAPPRARIDDRIDREGVRLKGSIADVNVLVDALVEAVPQTVRVSGPLATTLVFGQAAKAFLDEQRRRVTPTVVDHHLLKANDIAGVDEAESGLGFDLIEAAVVGRGLWADAVYSTLVPGAPLKIVHAKPWKRDVVAPATVEAFSDGFLIARRSFRGGGYYDSLREPKCDGDWGHVEMVAGGSVLRRVYYRENGDPIGELFNIQTPVEIGPNRVWYVDLEVDVVRTAEGRVTLVDLDELSQLADSGAMRLTVPERARAIADELARTLSAGLDWRSVALLDPAV